MSHHYWMTPAICTALLLAGCTTFSPDGGMNEVSTMTKARIGQPVERVNYLENSGAPSQTVVHLLAEPLTAESAMQIALLNNQGLQASLDELGIAEADFVQAARIHNPSLSYDNMRGTVSSEIDRSVMFDLVGLLTLPVRSKIEGERFEEARMQATASAVRLAAEARRAYFNAAAAQQSMQFIERVNISAQAGAELAQRMAKAGNSNQLEVMRQEIFYADAKAQLTRARDHALVQRERLARVLGLDDTDMASTTALTFTLPDHLPDLPPMPLPLNGSETQAMQQRLDIQMARRNVQATANALSLTRATGFLNVLDVGYHNMNNSEYATSPRLDGYEINLEIPIFDWGEAKSKKAESIYMAALHHTAAIALRARSEVRETYSAYRTSYTLALQYRDEIVPMQKRIADEVALRYNGMLTGVFELLAETREQAQSIKSAIDAQRDFWLADTDLQMAINGDGRVNAARQNADIDMN